AGGRAGSARPTARPTGRRSTRAGGTGTAVRRPLFTGRTVLLVGVVLLLALTLAGPVRGFLAGRAQLTQLAAERSAQQQQIRELEAQVGRQSDPAYIARQARQRLTYVLPGDRLVVVVDGKTAAGDAGTLPAGSQHSGAKPPWYTALMQSLSTADRSPAGGAPKGGR
ncbi:MAG: Septum formation initiator, partial [Frankiales bacterium]|nr:Septum formation initiator [Frankiales bacterium]